MAIMKKTQNEVISAKDFKKEAPKKRRQPEGALQRAIGSYLKSNTFVQNMNPNLLFFTYSGAGERKSNFTGILQNKKGLMKGDLDYRFEYRIDDLQHSVYIESKSSAGKLTKEQEAFIDAKKGLKNSRCYVVSSYYEFIDVLKKEKIILT